MTISSDNSRLYTGSTDESQWPVVEQLTALSLLSVPSSVCYVHISCTLSLLYVVALCGGYQMSWLKQEFCWRKRARLARITLVVRGGNCEEVVEYWLVKLADILMVSGEID